MHVTLNRKMRQNFIAKTLFVSTLVLLEIYIFEFNTFIDCSD